MKKILFISLLFPIIVFSQNDKNILAKYIPAAIPDYIVKNYLSHSTISYFIEYDEDTMCYEADFKYLKQRYSLLFDTLGNIIETEIEFSFQKLPETIEELIEQKLNTDFNAHKIVKCQTVDYRGKLLYEIAVRGKKNKEVNFYEYYFNRFGEFVDVERIDLKPIPSLY